MVAKVLHESGICLGNANDLMPADAHNADGYWEHVKFVQLNEEILNELGAAWDSPPPPDADWKRLCASPSIRDRVIALLDEFRASEPWGWKDPRTSLTLPFWLEFCPDLKVIICLRNPFEVAVSLRRRSGSSYTFGIRLWLLYSRSLLEFFDPSRTLVVHYASVLSNPEHEIRRMLEFLNIGASAGTIGQACASAREPLRHGHFTMRDLFSARIAPEPLRLYTQLCTLAGWSDVDHAPDASPDVVAAASHELPNDPKPDDAAVLDMAALDAELLRREPEDLWSVVSARDTWTRDLQARIGRREAMIGKLEAAVLSRDRDLASMRSQLNALRLQVDRLDAALNEERSRRLQLEDSAEQLKRRLLESEALVAKGGRHLITRAMRRWWFERYVKVRQRLQTPDRPAERKPSAAGVDNPPAEIAARTETYMAGLAIALGTDGRDYVPLTGEACRVEHASVKVIAFYLPQFYPIPENDVWWGKGFTEWSNVSKAVPQFAGHYQPHLPGELGFYDLRVPGVQRRQVELARTYGVFGFCFYYYWFAGRRLLDRPLAQFMADPAIDFPFCICWANENWTRRWDGKDNEILISQDHGAATDSAFIRDIEPIVRHPNYIRIGGRPVLIVYRTRLLSNPIATAGRWREYCQDKGLGNPYLIAAEVFETINPRAIGFDAVIEFPPNTPGPRHEITRDLALANPAYAGRVYRYSDLIELTSRRERPPYQLFKTVCPGWDNEPRCPGRGSTFAFSSPAAYGQWLDEACRFALADPDPEQHLVFVNAWNEWAEGAHLEPDRRYGYAYLQQTADVLRAQRARDTHGARASAAVGHIDKEL